MSKVTHPRAYDPYKLVSGRRRTEHTNIIHGRRTLERPLSRFRLTMTEDNKVGERCEGAEWMWTEARNKLGWSGGAP